MITSGKRRKEIAINRNIIYKIGNRKLFAIGEFIYAEGQGGVVIVGQGIDVGIVDV